MGKDDEIELDSLIRKLASGLSAAVGDVFFATLVKCLCDTLRVKYALVGQIDDSGPQPAVRTLAVAVNGEPAANFTHVLADSPCGQVVGHEACVYPHDVQRTFPKDRLLVELGAQSFVGAPLYDRHGAPLGIVAVVDVEPVENPDRIVAVLSIVAGRVAAELERIGAEEALRRSEQRYASALLAAGTGSWEWDTTTNKVFWSDAIEPMFGFKRGEFGGTYEAYLARVHPDDRAQVSETVQDALRNDTPYRTEHRVIWPNGEHRWVAARGTVVRDAQGNPLRMLGVVWDVTDRKLTEQALQRVRSKLQTLYDAIPDMIFLHAADGRIVAVNDNTATTTGYSREELLDIPFDKLCGEGYSWEIAKPLFDQALEGRPMDFEWLSRKKNGDEFPAEIRLRRIESPTNPQVPAVMAIARDITARKRVDEVINMLARSAGEVSFEYFLRECVRQLATVYQARYAFVGRLVEPDKTRIQTLAVWGGPAHVPNFDYDLEGTPCQDILDLKAEIIPRDAWKSYPKDVLLKDMGVESYFGAPLTATDGRILGIVSVLDVRPMTLDPWVRPVLGVFATRLANEIERHEVLEELKQTRANLEERVEQRTADLRAVNRELESFAYSVSHDLRAPLRTIDGFSRALEDDFGPKLGDEARHLISRVRGGAKRMGKLIDALLTLSRISRTELKPQRVDLTALARSVMEEVCDGSQPSKVDFDVAKGLSVYGDPELLRVALFNLLNNAVKYSGGRERPHIQLSSERRGDDNVFCISDNGVGFDMAYSDKLFVAFQRLHGADEFEGLGIGLATVQRVIHRHGGLIWAEAEPGKGARFYFTLANQKQGRRKQSRAA